MLSIWNNDFFGNTLTEYRFCCKLRVIAKGSFGWRTWLTKNLREALQKVDATKNKLTYKFTKFLIYLNCDYNPKFGNHYFARCIRNEIKDTIDPTVEKERNVILLRNHGSIHHALVVPVRCLETVPWKQTRDTVAPEIQ